MNVFGIATAGRVSSSALTMLTRGQISITVDGEDFGIIRTDHGPLTQGKGDGALAGLEDVTVRVDGNEATIEAVDAVGGIILIDDVPSAESEVEVDYFYTDNPILEMPTMSRQNTVFQRGSSFNYGSRFPYDGIFSDSNRQTRPNPVRQPIPLPPGIRTIRPPSTIPRLLSSISKFIPLAMQLGH